MSKVQQITGVFGVRPLGGTFGAVDYQLASGPHRTSVPGQSTRKDPMNAHRPILAMIATLVAGMAFASPASADPGNGATKVNQEYCQTTYLPNGDPFSTACFDLNYVVNTTVTPSGNTSYVANGKNSIPSYGHTTGCTFLGESQFHDHYLMKDGVLYERGDHQESSLTRNCPNGPQEKCTYTRRAHVVDGKFQYLIEDFKCVPLGQ